ncbi:hypothetical protein NPIL_683601, partial [Nephila pilipes]
MRDSLALLCFGDAYKCIYKDRLGEVKGVERTTAASSVVNKLELSSCPE